MIKAVIYVALKAGGMFTVAAAVISNNSLSITDRALIVAIVSGILGIIAVVLGQMLAGRNADKVLRAAEKNAELLAEIKSLNENQSATLHRIQDQTNGS